MSLVVPSGPNTAGQERRVKRGLRGFFQKYFSSFPDSPASSAPPSPRGASPVSSFRPSRSRRGDDSTARGSNGNSPSASRPVTPLRSHHPPSGVTVADRPITQPRPERSQRRRRRRRTQSPVGLPIYSEQPTENEMSLFKSHDDAFPAHGIYDEEDEEDDDDDDDEDDDEDGLEEVEGGQSDAEDTRGGTFSGPEAAEDAEDSDAFFAMPPRQSFDTTMTDSASRRRSATNLIGTGGDGSGRPTLRGRPRAASEPLGPRLTQQTTRSSLSRSVVMSNTPSANSPYLHGSTSPFASRSGLIELPPRPPSPPSPIAESPGSSSLRGFSFRPSYFTHRSSRSSPVFLHPDASPTTTRPPLLPTSASTGSFGGGGGGRPRASTLQKLMSSSAGTSSGSLAPPNGFEPASWESGASPYDSLETRGSGSQVSVGGRSISAPLANSFVHSSFVFPKTGPTPEQVAFISSRQAIGAYGYGAGASPPPALNIALSNHPQQQEREDEPVATSTTAEGADRQHGLIAPVPMRVGRGRSGSEASRMSAGGSPLARTVQLPELDLPALRDGLDTDEANNAVATAAAADLDEPEEDSSSLPSDPATTLAPTLPPLPTLDSITSGLSFSLADDEGDDEPALIHQAPAITTSAPTPTASAFPSPVIAPHPSFA